MTRDTLLDLAHLFRVEACAADDLTDEERRHLLDEAARMDARRRERRRIRLPEDWSDGDVFEGLRRAG